MLSPEVRRAVHIVRALSHPHAVLAAARALATEVERLDALVEHMAAQMGEPQG